ncbi:MAG: AMP-binding protein [Gammaproteobacteria bacterium]
MNLIELLDGVARRTPHMAAIIDGPAGREREISFAELCLWSRQIATLLGRAGVGPGDGIVILVPMSATLYAVIAAAFRIGAVPVFIEPDKAAAQIEYCRDALPLRAFVGSPMACLVRRLMPALRAMTPAFVTRGWFPGATPLGSAQHLPAFADAHFHADDAPAMLSFTSGSTGPAKGLLRSHRLLLDTQQILSRHLDLRPGSIDLVTMPALVMANLGAGITSLIPDVDLRRPAAADPAVLAGSIHRWRVESLFASPALVEHLADHCLMTGHTLNSLRGVFTGGAPVFPRILEKMSQTAPLARVASLYGSTEAEPMALLRSDQITADDHVSITRGAGLPAGKPISEIRLHILRDHWGHSLGGGSADEMDKLILPAGTVGEIVVSGPHVVTGYLHSCDDADSKFPVGDTIWHRTGDSGWLDDQNCLWLTGRCSARVGEPPRAVYPLTVEAALAGHPRLARVAFLNHRGERLLLVELKHTNRAVDSHELARALPWADIDRVVELPHIPLDRRHNAKIDYPALRVELEKARI